MNSDDRPRRRDRVLVQQVGDATVLLDVDAGTYFSLNDVGGRVWELCDGVRSAAEVVAVVCDEYDAPPAEVGADVQELLDDLVAERLIGTG